MINFISLQPEEASKILHKVTGSETLDIASIADLIRWEVSARSMCRKSLIIRYLKRMTAPAANMDDITVAEVCDLLNREGDIVLASGGVLCATPLRGINLGNGVVRVVCSLPTMRLSESMTGSWTVNGVSRECRFNDEEEAESAIVDAGGIVISPDGWACFDRVPCADQTWLDLLERRLQTQPGEAGSLEREEPLTWSACVAAEGSYKWVPPKAAKDARLWRTRNRWGHWLFAWTEEGSPSVSSFVSLHGDEATRTAFAVARVLSSPVEASIMKKKDMTELFIPTWLPIAEYRYLRISSTSNHTEKNSSRWFLPTDNRLNEVLETLHRRLGLRVRKETE